MSNTISAGIALGGEKEFKSAVSAIKDDMKVLASEAKLTAEQYRDNDKSLEALTKQTELYDKQADTQRQKISVLTDALENAQKQYGENSKQAKRWQDELNKAETELIKTERAIKQNNEQIEKMTSVTGKVKGAIDDWKKKVDDLKEKHETAYKGLKKFGEEAEKVAKGGLKLLGGAAAGAVAGVAAIGAAGIKAGKELAGLIKETADYGDKIEKNSQKVGMSAESYQKWDYAMTIAGTSMENCKTGLKTLSNTFDDAKNGSASAMEKFNRLGLSLDQLKGKSREEVFAATVKALQKVKDNTEKAALANDLFGKSGQDLMPMFNQTNEETERLMKNAEDLGLVMSNDAVAASATFQDSLTDLQGVISGTKNALVSEFLPGATDVIQGITGLFSGDKGATAQIKKGLDDMVTTFKDILPRGMEIFDTLIGAVIEVAPDVIISLADGIISNLDTILDSAIKVIEALTTGLLTEENIETIMNAGIEVVKKLVTFISENVDLLVDSAFDIIEALVNAFSDPESAEALVGGAIDIVVGVATGIIDNVAEIIPAALEMAKGIASALINYDWGKVGIEILKAVWNGMWKIGADLKDPVFMEYARVVQEERDRNAKPEPKTQKKHRSGLAYVPYDGYIAELHQGERVLTAYEAQTYSSGNSGSANEVRALRQELAAMREDMRRYGLPVDVRNANQIGKQVGKAVRAS